MSTAMLEVEDLAHVKGDGQPIISEITFTVNEGDVVVLRGVSGSGKTTLLKCIAHLNLYSGHVLFKGYPPTHYGIPTYRTKVLYIPQRPSLLPLTPRDFVLTVMSFKAHKRQHRGSGSVSGRSDAWMDHPLEVGSQFGIDPNLWNRNWAELSVGEGQRIMVAIGVALGTAEILLLDEPTSALDPETTLAVEKYTLSMFRKPESSVKAIIWVTHSEEQAQRVGTRIITIASGKACEELSAPIDLV
ncbi:P-loop containing nucleoside triphosphate hydrolase protein [Thelephora ganbajun]|uniref:P-loop containing nucleoside triphosphate hydrolase protein n=1 Tax=Thelephora ganbajun TaxID=370292 RepID=A0ACB6Z5W3_THEGA|nr:P-loop containing nucleoside triphosphate hydrolase protein [Thelephora ganbajun]